MTVRRARLQPILLPALALALVWIAVPAQANRDAVYEVSVTNVTKGQTFTPILVATHHARVRLFEVGGTASLPLEILAEDGDTAPLTEALKEKGSDVSDIETIPGLLGPGETATVKVRARRHHRRISVAAMLIPTNDTFVAVNAATLPYYGSKHVEAPAYDAGTEENDQSCAHIPGPRCGGEGHSPKPGGGDEGSIFIGNGFHDLDLEDAEGAEVLGPFTYDWRNPVARVVIRRFY